MEDLFRLSKMEMTGTKLTADQQKQLNVFQEKVNKLVFEAFSWDHVKPIYVKAYVNQFNDSELDGIVSFYKTPSGQAMVEKTPKLMTEASAAMQGRLRFIQP